ncbi:ankyrin [Pyrenochaeta sp. DS3sAY3a]|nr:ankyrin [Pyrenochaeta sp. DS3sAY3a]
MPRKSKEQKNKKDRGKDKKYKGKKGGNNEMEYTGSGNPYTSTSSDAQYNTPVKGLDEQLRDAVSTSHPNITEIQRLLNSGADVNAIDPDRRSILHDAVQHGNETVVQLLLDRNAAVNMKDSNGKTPIYEVVDIYPESQAAPIARILAKMGADMGVKDSDGFTPLFQVVEDGRADLIPLFVQLGSDVNARDGENWPLITYAASARPYNVHVVEELLKRGVDPKTRGGRYGNALQAAAVKGRNKTVQLLLKSGVSPNMPGGEFRFALQAAAFKGRERTVRILVAAGARIEGDEETLYEDAIAAAQAGTTGSHQRVATWLQEWKAGTATMEFQATTFTSWDNRRKRTMTITAMPLTYDEEDGTLEDSEIVLSSY